MSACPDAPAANCNPVWYVTPTLGSWGFAGAPPVGDQLGTTCNGTLPVNTCTPIFHNLLVQPPQNTAAGAYEGGFKVTQPANAVGVLKGNPSPMDALLPTDVSTGPSVIITALTDPAAVSSPTGTGDVALITLTGGGSGYTSAPAITFQGGCTVEPIATAVVVGGVVTQIVLNTPGSGCTSAPIVTIAPPTTAGGTQATATAIVSSSSLTVHFTDQVGSSITNPASQLIGVLPSRPGINVTFVGVNNVNNGGNPLWLTGASINLTNCTPAVFDPAQAEPGLFNGCEVTITPNPAIVATLPQGTYKAEVVLRAVGATPNVLSIIVQLDVLAGPTVIAPAVRPSTSTSATPPAWFRPRSRSRCR